MNNKRGSALLTVLWLTAALAAIGLAVASNVRGESERTTNGVEDAKAMFLARGALERAALHMLWGPFYSLPDGTSMYWRFGQPAFNFSFPTGEAHVDIMPEVSKLNVNHEAPEVLLRLLSLLGTPEDRALEITSAIVDWYTPVTRDRPSIFDPFYFSQTPSFVARHASFIENEELLLVKGITPDLYYGTSLPPGPPRPGLRDCVSVWGSSNLDINTVQPVVLNAVGIPPEAVTALIQMRNQAPVLDNPRLVAIQTELGNLGPRIRFGGMSMYTLRSTVRLRLPDGKLSDMRRTVSALVKFDVANNKEKRPPGWEVVRWYDRN